MSVVELHAFTRVERLEAVARVRFAVAAAGGWITGHQQFSNVSLCLWFEIGGGSLPALGEALQEAGILLPGELEAAAGEVSCSLQITFVPDGPEPWTPPQDLPR